VSGGDRKTLKSSDLCPAASQAREVFAENVGPNKISSRSLENLGLFYTKFS
jgi:hypothetical protein